MLTLNINDVVKHAESIHPGKPLAFSEAASIYDAIWQGDVGIILWGDSPPEGYKQVKPQRCLVLGEEESSTVGSKHCLRADFSKVQMFIPTNIVEGDLRGPYFVCSEPCVIEHPVHGDVSILADTPVLIRYQREYDEELKRERRAKD